MNAARDDQARWVEQALSQNEGPLLQYARHLVGDAHAANDVVQDAFLRLCEADRATVEGRVVPWLYRVVRNRAIDVRRRAKHVPKTNAEVLNGMASPPASPAATAEGRDSAAAAVEALGHLPDAQQEVLRLRLRHGLAYRDIAEVTGLTVSHVGVLIHEGLKALRKRLAPPSLPPLPLPAIVHAHDGGPR